MKSQPPLPSDKRPLRHHYDNQCFWRLRQDGEVSEVRFDSKSAWRSGVLASILCLVFGTIMFWLSNHWGCLAIMVPTALLVLGMNRHVTNREIAAGPLLRLHPALGKVELPRQKKSFEIGTVTLKLQIYSLAAEPVCELNIQLDVTGERIPLTGASGKPARLVRICKSLSKLGLRFQEEDFSQIKRP
jgi:hypothetical protein